MTAIILAMADVTVTCVHCLRAFQSELSPYPVCETCKAANHVGGHPLDCAACEWKLVRRA